MANKLRNKSARVSFFAFQDMITAVTGVLMVVMIGLSVDLTRRAASGSGATLASLERQVDHARQQFATNVQTLNQLQLKLNTQMDRVFVIPEQDLSGKEVVLVVLSAANGLATRPGQDSPVEFRVENGRTTFKQILETCNPAHDRLVFYVKPSGITHFKVCRDLALKRGYSIGYDVADEDRQYLLAPPGTL